MMALIRFASKDPKNIKELKALFIPLTPEVWIGDIPKRILKKLELILAEDPNSMIIFLNQSLDSCEFFRFENGNKKVFSFFELFACLI